MPNVARPQALAELGAVVSAGVQRQIADLFVAEERGSHELKGRTRRSLRMSSPPLEASRIQRQEMSVLAKSFSAVLLALPFSLAALSDPLPPDLTCRPLPTLPFFRVKAADEAQKAAVMQRQSALLNERYDLSDRAMQNVMMSGVVNRARKRL